MFSMTKLIWIYSTFNKDKSGFSRTRVKGVGWYFSLSVQISIGSTLFAKVPVFGVTVFCCCFFV